MIFRIITLCILIVSIITSPFTLAQSTIPSSREGTTNNTAVQGGINVAGGADSDRGDSLIQVTKTTINYSLGVLGFAALASGSPAKMMMVSVTWFGTTFAFYTMSLITK